MQITTKGKNMSQRILRVNESIRHALALIFERKVSSEIVNAIVTITEVQTAPDLHDAIVRVSIMGSESAKQKALHFLQKKRAELQHELGRKIHLKYTPRLDFRLDDTLEQGAKIMNIINELGIDDTDSNNHEDAH